MLCSATADAHPCIKRGGIGSPPSATQRRAGRLLGHNSTADQSAGVEHMWVAAVEQSVSPSLSLMLCREVSSSVHPLVEVKLGEGDGEVKGAVVGEGEGLG